MKLKGLIWSLIIIVSTGLTFGQTIIQSTCSNDTTIYYQSIADFSYEIALAEMRDENHYYHDSILVPKPFVDSIKNYVSAYHNSITLSDSIIDYRTFYYYNVEFGDILLIFDSTSNCYQNQDNELIIRNDTLEKYIDSLQLYPQNWGDNMISLSDTNTRINIYGDFNFFKNISCIKNVDIVFLAVDILPCYKSRFGDFQGDKLKITLADVNYCDNNDYSLNWVYTVNNDCQIEINSLPTSITRNINDFDINIYPNPLGDILNIDVEGSIKSIKILGLDGKLYLQYNIQNEKILNTSKLRAGLYLIEIETEKEISYRKIIKI